MIGFVYEMPWMGAMNNGGWPGCGMCMVPVVGSSFANGQCQKGVWKSLHDGITLFISAMIWL